MPEEKKDEFMIQWEYRITVHEVPKSKEEGKKNVIQCDLAGQCLVHDTSQIGIGWLESILRDQGKEGWELVQSGYHDREFLCIWKKEKEDSRKG